MHVSRDLLDAQLVDRDGERIGRIDGIVVELRDDAPPRITDFELGFVPLARRISRRFERFAERMHRRWIVRRSMRYHVPWSAVIEHDVHFVKVDLTAEETVAYDWERWIRDHIIGRIPGNSTEEK